MTKMTDSDEATPLHFPFHQAPCSAQIYSGINSAPVMHAKTCTMYSIPENLWDMCPVGGQVCAYLPCHVFFCLHETDLMR